MGSNASPFSGLTVSLRICQLNLSSDSSIKLREANLASSALSNCSVNVPAGNSSISVGSDGGEALGSLGSIPGALLGGSILIGSIVLQAAAAFCVFAVGAELSITIAPLCKLSLTVFSVSFLPAGDFLGSKFFVVCILFPKLLAPCGSFSDGGGDGSPCAIDMDTAVLIDFVLFALLAGGEVGADRAIHLGHSLSPSHVQRRHPSVAHFTFSGP